MAGIDTGDGGFSIDDKTYTFDVGDPSAPGVEPKPTARGDLHVDNSKKDISKRTKETLSKYLGNLTANNAYGVDPQAVEKAITSPQGTPVPLSDTDNSEQFIDRKEIQLPFDLPQQLRSGNSAPALQMLYDILSKHNENLQAIRREGFKRITDKKEESQERRSCSPR